MTADRLKLTVYFGESDRSGRRLLSDVLLDRFERAGVHSALLLRAVEGFGITQQLRTDRLLTLSEDLPLVAIAVDDRGRVDPLVPEVRALVTGGLITLERAGLVADDVAPADLHEQTKLTVHLGRDERHGRRPAYLEVVERLRASGVAGATVLLGLDGMAHGQRQRARFFSRNAAVPLLVVGVGGRDPVARALGRLGDVLDEPEATVERVRVCKRDGVLLAEPTVLPETDAAGLGVWQKLTVYAGEQARHGGHPLYVQLVRRLREEGASGVTALRGIWGFSGDHPPHGDRLFAVHRRVPVVTTVVDTPERIRRWFRVVDEVTESAGLVTSETVPALEAVGPDVRRGGLRLSRP